MPGSATACRRSCTSSSRSWRSGSASSDDVARHTASLRVPDQGVQLRAIGELAEIGGLEAAEALIEALKYPDPVVRVEAAYALGKIGDAGAVRALISLLPDPETGVPSARALGEIGDPRAVPALIAMLDAGRDDPLAGIAAARALGAIGDTSAYEALADVANDESASDGLQMAAQDSLDAIDPRPDNRPPQAALWALASGSLLLLALGLVAAPLLGLLALVPLIGAAILMLIYRLKAAPGTYQHEDGSSWWQIWGGDGTGGGGGNGGGGGGS